MSIEITNGKDNIITLILRVTHSCNLKCRYCYYSSSLDNCEMNITLIEDVFNFYSLSHFKINVIIHGGEPLLRPISFFSKIIDIESIINKERGTIFYNKIQTNGTIYSKNISRFLCDNKINIGVSFDCIESEQNMNRPFFNGSPSYNKVINNILKYRQDGISVTALMVATKKTVQKPYLIYKTFKDISINFKINELINIKKLNTYDIPTYEELGDFYCKIFDFWIKDKKEPYLIIEPVASTVLMMLKKKKAFGCFGRNCLNYLSIETNGDIFFCGRFLKLQETKLENFINNKNRISSKYDILNNNHIFKVHNNECIECKWLDICNGGCAASAYWDGEGINGKSYWCKTKQIYYEYINNQLKQIYHAETGRTKY